MENEKVEQVVVDEVVNTTEDTPKVVEDPNKVALIKRASELEKSYSNLVAIANNTVKTINELKDRTLKQEEALNITNAQLIKIESEYDEIQKKLKGMN